MLQKSLREGFGFTQYYYKAPGDPIMQTVPIGAGAYIPRLGDFVPGLPSRIPVSVAFLLAMRSCFLSIW